MTGRHEVLSGGGPVTRLGVLVAAGRRRHLPPFVPRPLRTSTDWIVCVVTDGAGRYESPGAPSRPVRAPAAIVVPPGVAHWYGAERGAVWTETWVMFAGPLFDLLAADARAAGGVVPLPDPASPSALVRALRHRDAERQLIDLFAWLTGIVVPAAGAVSPQIRAALGLLGSHLEMPLTMPEVARQVGLGYDAFRRAFRDQVGVSPLAYRSQRRTQAAANLVATTDLTLSAVARAVGFVDEFHLSRRFRAAHGVPPSQYRRRRRVSPER